MANPSEAPPRALITGLEGFTGRYLAAELAAHGYAVAGTVRRMDAHAPAGAHECDLLDQAALEQVVDQVQPDVVIHLAAISFVAHTEADAVYRTNISGTRNLLQALARLRRTPRSVLLASSANVYGNACSGAIDEAVVPQPANDYAVSKLAMEHMARLWLDRLPIVVARPFNYTGVGQAAQFLLPKIVGSFRRGEPAIELGNIEVERDFSDVRAVVAAYRSLIEHAPPASTFNVCSGTATSLRQVLALMEEIAGRSIQVRVNPAFVRASEVHRLWGDGSAFRRLAPDWQPIALPDTLRWMFQAPQLP